MFPNSFSKLQQRFRTAISIGQNFVDGGIKMSSSSAAEEVGTKIFQSYDGATKILPIDLKNFETAVNRSLRNIHREVVKNAKAIATLASDTNMGFDTIKAKFDSVLSDLPQNSNQAGNFGPQNSAMPSFNQNFQQSFFANPPYPPPFSHKPPPKSAPRHNSPIHTANFEDDEVFDDANDDGEAGENGKFILALTSEGLGTFSSSSSQSFSAWATKFRDYIEALGTKWSEGEKLGRLKLMLEGHPRQILEELEAEKKDTLENALKHLTATIDSPQKRDLARATLSASKHESGETVSQLIEKLTPLVESAYSTLTPQERRQRLCEVLLDKLDPEISFLVKLTGAHADLESARNKALEVESMLALKRNDRQLWAMNGTGTSKPQQNSQGKFNSFIPNNQPQNNFNQRNTDRNMFSRNQQNNRNQNNQGQFNKNNYFCTHCKRSGHSNSRCRFLNNPNFTPISNQRSNNRNPNFQNRGNNSNRGNHQNRGGNYQNRNSNNQNRNPQYNPQNQINALDIEQISELVRQQIISDMNSKPGEINSISKPLPENEEKVKIPEPAKIEHKPVENPPDPKMIKSWELPSSIGPQLFLFTLLALSFAPAFAQINPPHPIICQQHVQGTYWKIPSAMQCPKIHTPILSDPIPQTIKIYKPNQVDAIQDAWACRIIKQSLREYTNPFDDQIKERFQPEQMDVTQQECTHMISQKRCRIDSLVQENELWHTNKQLIPAKRLPIVGWTWKTWSVENCFLFKTTIIINHEDLTFVSPAGDTARCKYNQKFCKLPDKTTLVWKQNRNELCKYKSIGKFQGHQIQSAWISNENEIALSLPKASQTINDCNHTLLLTEQEFAIEYVTYNETQRRRAKRGVQKAKNSFQDTVVFESELVARLTYLDHTLKKSISSTLTHALSSICRAFDETKHYAMVSIMSNPTMLARAIFQNPILTAKQVTSDTIQIWPCAKLESKHYHWKATQGECFEYLPIQIQTSSGPQFAFIDPLTMMVSPSSKKSPFCKTAIEINNSLIEVDQLTGKITPIKPSLMKINPINPLNLDELKPHAFHAIALSNFTDIITHSLIASQSKFSEISYKIESFGDDMHVTSSLSQEWEQAKSEILKEIFGFDLMDLWRIIITIICVLLSIDLSLRIHISIQKRIHKSKEITINLNRKPSIKFANQPKEEDYEEPITFIKGNPRAWPPSVSFPVQPNGKIVQTPVICAIEAPDEWGSPRMNRASTFVKFNGIEFLTLIDTGSTNTIIDGRFVCEFVDQGFRVLPATNVIVATCGCELQMTNYSVARIEIAGLEVTQNIYFVEDFMPGVNHSAIIGSDVLKNLPPITFDFRNGAMSFGSDHITEMWLSGKTHPTIAAMTPSAAIWLNINNAELKCLLDTGASLSATSIATAKHFGWPIEEKESSACSASGHWMKIVGQSKIEIPIGKEKFKLNIELILDEHFSKSCDYQVIIGCDIMAEMPPVTFDFANENIKIGKIFFPMINSFLPNFPFKIQAIESTTLMPNSINFVKAKAKINNPTIPLLIEQQSLLLAEMNIDIIPGILSKNENHFLLPLSNPCNDPKLIHKNRTLAFAYKVEFENESGIYREPTPNIAAIQLDQVQQNAPNIDPAYIIDFSKCDVQGTELEKLKALCEKYDDVFSKSQYDLGCCSVAEHHIETTTENPIYNRPRRTPFKYKQELDKHMQNLVEAKIFVESDTPWVSNFVLVSKKDGGMRPCIDFIKLNEITVPDHYPLPRFETILEKIAHSHYYSSLDLSSGYFQIKLTEDASRKCGVITEDKVYQAIRMPFGLKNATSAFARMMAVVMFGLEDTIVYFVDDSLVYTKEPNFDSHLESLEKVFTRFRTYNLKLNPKKCVFATRQMQFLGFKISKDGYSPSLSKIEVIAALPPPKTLKQVRRAVGMASFFRRHVPNFSSIVEPLTRLTKKETSFNWGDEQQKALDKVKEILSTEPVLAFPDYTKPFHIFTDASLVGQGGALMQKGENNLFRAICYCSRTLSASERKWPAVQVELSAIVFALREFRAFIYQSEVILHTDHKPLTYLMKKADSAPNLGRWLIELQNYNIKIVHIKGNENSLADALSRAAEDLPEKEVKNLSELEDIAEFPICLAINLDSRIVQDPFINAITIRGADGKPFSANIQKELQEDPEAKSFLEYLQNGTIPDLSEQDLEIFMAKTLNLKADAGILYFQPPNHVPKIYIPISLRLLVFEAMHTSPLAGGHMSLKKTFSKMRKFYWPKMHCDIQTWTRQCVTCQLRQSPTPAYRSEMMSVPVNTIFAKLGLDLTGPFPVSQKGNKYILNIICWFSKYVISVPVSDTKSLTIARALLHNVYLKFGGCTHLISDNASTFTSDFFRTFCKLLYVNKSFATPHYSRGNGITERTFRTFHSILSKYLDPREHDFEDMLDCANFAYNTSMHESTQESPYFLMFGRDPIFNIEHILDPRMKIPLSYPDMEFKGKLVICLRKAWKAAAEAIKSAQERMKLQYDKNVRSIDISPGDKVLLKNFITVPGSAKKWRSPWRGAFRVIEKDNQHLTIVSCASPQSNPFRVHINQVKKFHEPCVPAITSEKLSEEERIALAEIEAEELLDYPGHSHQVPEIDENAKSDFQQPSNDEPEAEKPTQRYNLRNRAPKLRAVTFLAIFATLISPTLASDEQLSLQYIIFELIFGILGGFLFVLTLLSFENHVDDAQPNPQPNPNLTESQTFPTPPNLQRNPNQNIVKCEFCGFSYHERKECIHRKLEIKRGLRNQHFPQGHDENVVTNIANSYGQRIDELGSERGKKFYSIRKSLRPVQFDYYCIYIPERNSFKIRDIFNFGWRDAHIVEETAVDIIFDMHPKHDPESKNFAPSYFLMLTRA